MRDMIADDANVIHVQVVTCLCDLTSTAKNERRATMRQHYNAEMSVGSVVLGLRTGRSRDFRRNPLVTSNTSVDETLIPFDLRHLEVLFRHPRQHSTRLLRKDNVPNAPYTEKVVSKTAQAENSCCLRRCKYNKDRSDLLSIPVLREKEEPIPRS